MPSRPALSHDGRVALVTCAGELDVADEGWLRSALGHAADSGASVVVVDLREVSFVDSTVLDVLVEAQHALAPRRLVLAGPSGLPLRALQITGLDTVLEVVQAGSVLRQADLDEVLPG